MDYNTNNYVDFAFGVSDFIQSYYSDSNVFIAGDSGGLFLVEFSCDNNECRDQESIYFDIYSYNQYIVSNNKSIINTEKNNSRRISIYDNQPWNLLWQSSVEDGELFILHNDNLIIWNDMQISCYDINTYALNWTYDPDFGGIIKIFPYDSNHLLIYTDSTQFIQDPDNINRYITIDLNTIGFFNLDTQEVEWTKEFSGKAWPIINDNKDYIYVLEHYTLNKLSTTGEILSQNTLPVNDYVDGFPFVCDDHLYTNVDDTAYIMNVNTGDIAGKCEDRYLFENGIFRNGYYYSVNLNSIDIYRVEGSTCSMEYSPNQIYYSDE